MAVSDVGTEFEEFSLVSLIVLVDTLGEQIQTLYGIDYIRVVFVTCAYVCPILRNHSLGIKADEHILVRHPEVTAIECACADIVAVAVARLRADSCIGERENHLIFIAVVECAVVGHTHVICGNAADVV